jgi:hypothetical protein
LAGGQDAADHFMGKVRDHLASIPTINEPNSIPVMVKAFANLGGLAQACVRDKKVKSVKDVNQFWIGFVRRFALVDFVDVGAGKEEADNKIRGNVSVLDRMRSFSLTIAQKFLVSISATFNVSILCSPVAMTQVMSLFLDIMLLSHPILIVSLCFHLVLFDQISAI